MKPSDTLGLALQNVRRTRLRTFLSALGVAIGTAAVVALVAAGNGFQNIAVDRAARFGSLTEIIVFPEQDNGTPHPITPTTVASLRSIAHVASVDLSLQTPPIRVQLDGTSADLPSGARTPVDAGGGVLSRATPMPADGVLLPVSFVKKAGETATSVVGEPVSLIAGSSVCCATDRNTLTVLGPDHTFQAHVAGVYDDTATATPADRGSNPSIVFVTAELGATIDGAFGGLTGGEYIDHQGYSSALVTADDARQTSAIAETIRSQRFRVQDRADLLAQVHLVFTIITAGLAAVGSIALLVAAIGIANTMIMTVLERTREIGIMKALGAEPGAIRSLFLVESALVGILGGLAGVLFAFGSVLLGNAAFSRFVQNQNPGNTVPDLFIVTPVLIAFGLGLALAISLVGGALPSRRAVRLQPLDALRYE
ncbi:MAG TPA: ABC transporter permease [Candidatus Dormibacteraeota bacterium]|nr:ABC transporter permease [Candidatus Dormibacteraeota bacterium]